MDGAVMGQHIRAVPERMTITVADTQTGSRPPQMQQAQVSQRLLGQLVKLRRALGAHRRLPDPRLAGLVPGHPPAVAVQGRKRGEVMETLVPHELGDRRLAPGAIAKQPAHNTSTPTGTFPSRRRCRSTRLRCNWPGRSPGT